MRKFFKNSAYPSLALSPRNLTKKEFKQLNQVWRVLDPVGRVNYFNASDYRILRIVELDKDGIDPLLRLSVTLAISIEYSQLMRAA